MKLQSSGEKTNGCCAVLEDSTALLLSAVGSFRKMFDLQEMSTMLLHLTYKQDSVECTRMFLEGGTAGSQLPPSMPGPS